MMLRTSIKRWLLHGPLAAYLPLDTLRVILRRVRYNRWNREAFSDLYEHEKMLSDRVRVGNYAAGIKSLIQPGQTVVDLGTGNGILSMLAAARKPKKIYALDHSRFIDVARQLADSNNIDCIEFINKNSRSFEPSEKVDVILHEQMGDDLFSENMLENILELKERMLKPNGIVVPAKFDLYLEPVSLHDEYRVQRFHEHRIEGVDFSVFKDNPLTDKYRTHSYDRHFLIASAFSGLLCKPEPVLSLDLNTLKSLDEIKLQHRSLRTTIAGGRLDGLVLYFRCRFTDIIGFDTSPFNTHTHWGNRFFRADSQPVKPGDKIMLDLNMGSIRMCTTWEYDLSVNAGRVTADNRITAKQTESETV